MWVKEHGKSCYWHRSLIFKLACFQSSEKRYPCYPLTIHFIFKMAQTRFDTVSLQICFSFSRFFHREDSGKRSKAWTPMQIQGVYIAAEGENWVKIGWQSLLGMLLYHLSSVIASQKSMISKDVGGGEAWSCLNWMCQTLLTLHGGLTLPDQWMGVGWGKRGRGSRGGRGTMVGM